MRSLTIKLTLASLCSSLVSLMLVGLFARYQTGVAFDRFVQDRRAGAAVQNAAGYYVQHGSWAGLDAALHMAEARAPGGRPSNPPPDRSPPGDRPPAGGPSGPPPSEQPPAGGPSGPPPYIVVDRSGTSLTNGPGYRLGDLVPADLLAHGAPVEVQGLQVGTIVMTGSQAELDSGEREFLTRTNRTLLAAMLGGGLSALLIGVVLTQLLTRPIRALTAAIHAMQRGSLRQEVRISSRDEFGELIGAFNQLSHDLARATQLRRQMTADIAHELRTPLSVLMGYIETMRDGLLPPSHERFQTMFVEANQLHRLIDDLRLLSLADAGELSLHPQPTNPDQLLVTVTAAFAQQAAQQHVALHVQPSAGLPQLMVDQERMIQVLGNLVSNALRYTPAGGTITLSAVWVDAQMRLEVRDSGCGIAPDVLPAIFERMYRADQSRAAKNGGSGLGLAIVKTIVEAHGGAITADSAPGAGTRMTICLPLQLHQTVPAPRGAGNRVI
jgi:signal transduction histidine kinase